MLERLTWMHLSDVHLKSGDGHWSQNTVLKRLVHDVENRTRGNRPRFIILSGDIAWSGIAPEYTLAEAFLDALRTSLQLPRDRIFAVPGNHDVCRAIHTLAYHGARATLTSLASIHRLQEPRSELRYLLRRQRAYRAFARNYLGNQSARTPDGLAYVSDLDIDGIRIGIIGLNTSWLCEGDTIDYRKLIIGERQLEEAIALAESRNAAITLCIGHHPSDWLLPIDEQHFLRRLPRFTVYHRGHMHEPGVAVASSLGDERCIISAAGAGYSGAEFENSYSLVSLGLDDGFCAVTPLYYKSGTFVAAEPLRSRYYVNQAGLMSAWDIVQCLAEVAPLCSPWKHYLAALLHGSRTDVPVRVSSEQWILGSPALLQHVDTPESVSVLEFLSLRMLLRMHGSSESAKQRLASSLHRIKPMIDILTTLRSTPFGEHLRTADAMAATVVAASDIGSRHNSESLLQSLFAERDWDAMAQLSIRLKESPDARLAALGTRYEAISQVHSTDAMQQANGARTLHAIASDANATEADVCIAAASLHGCKLSRDAKDLIEQWLSMQHSASRAIIDLVNRIAMDTGDREFRTRCTQGVRRS